MIAALAFAAGALLGWAARALWRAYRIRTLSRCIVCGGAGCYRKADGHAMLEGMFQAAGREPPL